VQKTVTVACTQLLHHSVASAQYENHMQKTVLQQTDSTWKLHNICANIMRHLEHQSEPCKQAPSVLLSRRALQEQWLFQMETKCLHGSAFLLSELLMSADQKHH
jgi:hypothetical protein